MKRVEFTKEMKKTHTILAPNMLDIHFRMLKKIFECYGYKVEFLTDGGRQAIDEGLKYVHNDTCYPALLTIGQLVCALKSGKYDLNTTALLMTQTGGGCRASNYIHLIRKALVSAGFEDIPVISMNTSGLEKNSGFKLTLPIIRRILAGTVYGDLLMLLENQTRPYEVQKGQTVALTQWWIEKMSSMFASRQGFTRRDIQRYMKKMVESYADIEINKVPKVKVGIVGEIYVKYSASANNHLEEFLASQDCEVMVPGAMNFLLYCIDSRIDDINLYGGSAIKKFGLQTALNYLIHFETDMLSALKDNGFTVPATFLQTKALGKPFISSGCKMGEGWLLTAEMVELIHSGYSNIICAQPFGCLPNHIAGKGMIRKITAVHPLANIVPIDYDPSATKVNQENRIKLMLAVAKENLENNSLSEDITIKSEPIAEYLEMSAL